MAFGGCGTIIDNIKVAIRIRPFLPSEKSCQAVDSWKIKDNSIYQVDQKGQILYEPFYFDHIFEDKSNVDIYNEIVKSFVESSLEGINSTIFAYGQTSSGKTYTMLGNESNPGIVQLAIKQIFEQINNCLDRKFLLRVSFIEIYNERINDLLGESNKEIKIRELINVGIVLQDAVEEVVTCPEEAYDLLRAGTALRRTGDTQANLQSSRSHTIFRLIIESTEANVQNSGSIQVSHLNLIDLAGSERVAQTKATGIRLKEGSHINKSLSTLALVIRQLSDGQEFINFRDSKLTRLLQNSLGGNARTLVIANITLASIEDTNSTLSFAQRAKIVKNKPTKNEICKNENKNSLIEQYKKQLMEQLKENKVLELQKQDSVLKIERLQKRLKLLSQFNGDDRTGQDTFKSKRRHTIGPAPSKVFLKPILEPIIESTENAEEEPVFKDISKEQTPDKSLHERLRLVESEYEQLRQYHADEIQTLKQHYEEILKTERETLEKRFEMYEGLPESQNTKVDVEIQTETIVQDECVSNKIVSDIYFNELRDMSNELKTLQTLLNNDNQCINLEEEFKQNENLKKENEKIHLELIRLEEELKKQKKEHQDKLKQLEDEHDTVTVLEKKYNNKIVDLEKQLSNLNNNHAMEINKIKEEISSLNQNLKEKDDENLSLKSQLVQYSKLIDHFKYENNCLCKEIKEELHRIQALTTSTQNAIRMKEKDINSLEQKYEIEYKEKLEKITFMEEKIYMFTDRLIKLQTECKRSTSLAEERTKELHEKEEQLSRFIQEIYNRNCQIEELKNSLKATEQEKAQLLKNLLNKEGELHQMTIQKIDEDLFGLLAAIQVAEDAVASPSSENLNNSRLRDSKLKIKNNQNSDLEHKIKDHDHTKELFKRKIRQLKDDNINLTEKLQAKTERLVKLQSEIDRLKESLEEAVANNETLKAQMVEMIQSVKQKDQLLLNENNEMKEKLNSLVGERLAEFVAIENKNCDKCADLKALFEKEKDAILSKALHYKEMAMEGTRRIHLLEDALKAGNKSNKVPLTKKPLQEVRQPSCVHCAQLQEKLDNYEDIEKKYFITLDKYEQSTVDKNKYETLYKQKLTEFEYLQKNFNVMYQDLESWKMSAQSYESLYKTYQQKLADTKEPKTSVAIQVDDGQLDTIKKKCEKYKELSKMRMAECETLKKILEEKKDVDDCKFIDIKEYNTLKDKYELVKKLCLERRREIQKLKHPQNFNGTADIATNIGSNTAESSVLTTDTANSVSDCEISQNKNLDHYKCIQQYNSLREKYELLKRLSQGRGRDIQRFKQPSRNTGTGGTTGALPTILQNESPSTTVDGPFNFPKS